MQCVVGTPGRVLDMSGKRRFRVDFLVFVLDEADEMLSRGFKDQIYDIFQNFAQQDVFEFVFACELEAFLAGF